MIKRKIVLHFPKEKVEEAIIYKLVKDYDLVPNILKARIESDEEGLAVLELSGEDKNYAKGIEYLEKLGIRMQPLEKDINRDEKKCTQCSACVAHCPTGALHIKDRETMEIGFDKEKCILCEACISVCPVKAMSLKF